MSGADVHAAIYARRSQDQPGMRDEAKSVTRQVEAGRTFVIKQGWLLDGKHIYTDNDISGFLFLGRPGFQAMLRAAKADEFERLVFWDLDRFGRNSRRTMEALYVLADLGVEVWDASTGRRVDLDSFEGRVLTTFRAEFAQWESEQAQHRTRAKMWDMARKGQWPGGRPYGYRIVKQVGRPDLATNDLEAPVALEIWELFAADARLSETADRLNTRGVPSPRGKKWSERGLRANARIEVHHRTRHPTELPRLAQ